MPLRVLCEKFAHTRFEPSGWTGNEQIGYAKSLMDYIFRWLNLRFLSGTQLTLFAGLAPQAPQLPASPTLIPEHGPEDGRRHVPRVSCPDLPRRSHGNWQAGRAWAHIGAGSAASHRRFGVGSRTGPAHGPVMQDRGIYHAADAMREMYDMGDAPSCGTCGAIMVATAVATAA